MRISKDPEERKAELIDAAETLFLEKGYDATAVSDIVRTVGVAQGTFYYHFRSKDDILESVLMKNIEVIERVLQGVLGRNNLDDAAKLNEMIGVVFGAVKVRRELVNHIHRIGNDVIHAKFVNIARNSLVPFFTEALEGGMKTGVFDVGNPKETAEIILAAVAYQFDHPTIWNDGDGKKRMSRTLELFLARLLKTKEGTFSIEL